MADDARHADYIVHENLGVNPELVWDTIHEDLPDVVAELRRAVWNADSQ